MVTGIEAAGLVLGAFPIVIDGLRYYIDSVKKAKQAACHKYVLPRFIRDIETGMTIFVDTWYHLTGYYPPQVTAGGLPEACIPKLPTHLRPKSIASMCTVCENMLGVLEELRKKLEKYKKSEVGSQPSFATKLGYMCNCINTNFVFFACGVRLAIRRCFNLPSASPRSTV